MKYILDLMKDSAKKLDDPIQIKMLREILEPTFKELIEYTDEMYLNLEKRVYKDILPEEQNYEIFSTLLNKDELNYQGIYFSPLISREKEELREKSVLQELKIGNAAILERIFIPLSADRIKQLSLGSKEFTAHICCKDEKCKISVMLEESKEYLEKEKEIYELFYKNNLKWKSINNPYIRKMFDVVAVKVRGDIDLIEEITDIEYEFGDFEYSKNLIPVWNIFEKKKTVSGSIDPAGDGLNYSYNFNDEDLKNDNVVIPYTENAEIKAVYKEAEGEYKIVCDKSESMGWNFFIFRNIENLEKEDKKYPVFRNNTSSSFDRFKRKNNVIIRTKSEIFRRAELYGKDYGIRLIDVGLHEYYEGESHAYDVNQFIRDEIRVRETNKYLILKFEALEKNYLTQDILSFIVAEIQLEITDFKCIGVLL